MIQETKKRLPPVLLEPRGPYRVGDVVSASWSMTNLSDRAFAGGRLLVALPDAVDAIAAGSWVADAHGDAIAPVFSPEGFDLGTIGRGESVSAVFDLRIARETRDARELTLRLALGDGSSYDAEPVALELRARALLAVAGPPRVFEIDAAADRFGVALRLENQGEMRAERVELVVPAHEAFSFAGARCGATDLALGDGGTIALPEIARGASLDVALAFEARAPRALANLELDGLRVNYAGGRLLPEPIPLRIERESGRIAASLSAAARTIVPGEIVRIELALANAGRGAARDVAASIALPRELTYRPGSLAIDGAADGAPIDPRSIAIDAIRGNATVTVSFLAAVGAARCGGETVAVRAFVDGVDVLPLELEMHAEPAFARTPDAFELEGPLAVAAGETRTLRLRATNVGTADAADVRVRFTAPDLIVDAATLVRRDGARAPVALRPVVSQDGVASAVAELGEIAASEAATLELAVRAPDHFADGDAFAMRGDVRFAGGAERALGALTLVGRCRADIDPRESGLSSLRGDPLGVGHVRTYALRVKNSGLAPARGVSVSLNLPGMLAIEAINGKPARGDVVTIRDIAPGAAVEVPIALRLVDAVDGGGVVVVTPVAGGDGISSVRLAPASIATAGRAVLDEFLTTVELQGREALVTLAFRNVGDAAAHHVVVAALDLPSAYVADTTRVGAAAVPDLGDGSLLSRGITLPAIAPGRHVSVSYRMTDCDADGARLAFAIRRRAQAEIRPAATVHRATTEPVVVEIVREEPRFAIEDVPSFDAIARAPEPAAAVAPPEHALAAATPGFAGANVKRVTRPARAAAGATAPDAPNERASASHTTGLAGYTVLDPAEVDRLRRIGESVLAVSALGTYRHLFALRALAPRSLLGASPDVARQWKAVHDRARADLRAPLLAVGAPGFAATASWADRFENRESSQAAKGAIAAIRQARAEAVGYDDAPARDDRIRGAIGDDFETYLAPAAEPSGSTFNLILADAIPTESSRDPHLAKALKRYRERLKLFFAALLYQTPAARHERMLSGLDGELDDTLRAIVDRLADPRWS